jgi:hypothetical protein
MSEPKPPRWGLVRAGARVSGGAGLITKTRYPDWLLNRAPAFDRRATQQTRNGARAKRIARTSRRFPPRGRCRRLEECARLRTSGEKERQECRFRGPLCVKRVNFTTEVRCSPDRETRKARKDAMPHERGSMPVLPSEFSIATLADPKARFCCSPPPKAFAHRIPPNLLTPGYLNQSRKTRHLRAWPFSSWPGSVVTL